MTPARWQQIKAIFQDASERAVAERAAFLDAACAGDAELRREVESLLATDEGAGSFLAQPALKRDTVATAADSSAAALLEEQAELAAGQMVGHYRVERRLGAGGMGVVYLARDTKLGRPVALKLLAMNFTRDAARVRRFRQEARAASTLNHPNIITIHEVGRAQVEAGEAHFIATEFIDGVTLREQCRNGGMTLGAALTLLRQVASALAAAHAAGIVHRDIKPENIMLRADGVAKVLDFGLAKLTERRGDAATGGRADTATIFAPSPSRSLAQSFSTQPGIVIGTIHYMSPEQARGLEVDARSDLFSLGVVMYELFTGHTPFEGQTAVDTLAALIGGEPRPLTRYAPQLPAALQPIIDRALAKLVADRYQTARALGDDLRALQEELEFAARLQARAGSDDDVLKLNVGAAATSEEQTTFATQLGTAARAQETGSALATRPITRPLVPLTTARRFVWRGGWRQHRAAALLASLLLTAALVWFGHAWLVGWSKTRSTARGAASTGSIDTVAVLPFVNVGNDPQMEYLPDGITESLIRSLSQLPALRVMSRGAVFAYKQREADPRQVGAALGVRGVVTGRVERQGERLLIRVELTDAANGMQLWSEEYPRPMADLLTVQEEIAREITDALRLRLSGSEQRQLAKRATQNTEAYGLYLQGRYYWNRRTPQDILQSVPLLQQAVTKDPSYALAHVGLADAYATLGAYHVRAPREVLPLARQSAVQALTIDPDLAEAHASLGKILTDYYWDWAQAERELQRALALNPNYANAHHWYSSLLAVLGRFDEAVPEARRALELDHLSPAASTQLGNVLYQARRYDEAVAVLRETLAREPGFFSARLYLGACYVMQGRTEAAVAEFEQARQTTPNIPDVVGMLGYGYGRAGRRAEARRCLAELEQLSQHTYVQPSLRAAIYGGLGELDPFFAWMEKSFEERSPTIRSLKTGPLYDPMRNDPRFVSLLRRAGLSE